ncbi:MAG: ankyrin repeat domain-containing protein [Brevinema sp.]
MFSCSAFVLEYGHKDIVRYLLQQGANLHAQEDHGRMPIHKACVNSHLKVVNLLLEHGADPKAKDNTNCTPLHMAAKYGRIDICIGKVEIFQKKKKERV